MPASVLIPTLGRPTLLMAVASATQEPAVEEILVVADGTVALETAIEMVPNSPLITVVGVEGPHNDWGHYIRHTSVGLLKGPWVVFLDDDNVLYPGALTAGLMDAAGSQALLFQVELGGDKIVPQGEPVFGGMDGLGLVVRKEVLLEHPWPEGQYGGDWKLYEELVAAGIQPKLVPRVIGRHG